MEIKQEITTNNKLIIMVGGPTAAGKSDFACDLALKIKGEIINADVGQFYSPLSIGTAKPNWELHPTRHHLFDVLNTPTDYTVIAYRNSVLTLIGDIWSRGSIPIIVGGSGFYLKSILFPPVSQTSHAILSHAGDRDGNRKDVNSTWEFLNEIDPERAGRIHPNDQYRIARALQIWETTGIKPSQFVCNYQPIAQTYFLWVTREKQELDHRINSRVLQMLEQGWLEECRSLISTAWEDFVGKKKLIGYSELLSYLKKQSPFLNLKDVIATIQQKTRSYAKRQTTFWCSLKNKLEELVHVRIPVNTVELNLTLSDHHLYINQLLQVLREG